MNLLSLLLLIQGSCCIAIGCLYSIGDIVALFVDAKPPWGRSTALLLLTVGLIALRLRQS